MKNFIEKIESLDNITQWSERDSIIKESVSQHSFKVAAIANYLLKMLGRDVNKECEQCFTDFSCEALSYAIMHDFDEAIFGRDVSHMVKYNNFNGDAIRKSIDEYVEHVANIEFSGLFFKPKYIVKKFVKLCDWIALLTFVKRNVNMGAKTFSKESSYCNSMIIDHINEIEAIFTSEFRTKIDLSKIIKIEELWKI